VIRTFSSVSRTRMKGSVVKLVGYYSQCNGATMRDKIRTVWRVVSWIFPYNIHHIPLNLYSFKTNRISSIIFVIVHIHTLVNQFTMTPTTTVSTPLPTGCTPEQAIAALHNHELYIRITCPQLVSHKLLSGKPDVNEPCVYEVTDKKPIGQTTFKLTLINVADGIDTLVNAKPPIGTLTISGKWRVVEGQLVEEVTIDANMLVRKMVKGNLEKSQPEQHVALLAEASKR